METAVVFNRLLPESEDVARYYAERRQVPSNHLFGLDLPSTEATSRLEYRQRLEDPLRTALERAELLQVPKDKADGVGRAAVARIRYLVLCYGVPVKILPAADLQEPNAAQLPPNLQRNEAAVDSELATLPQRVAPFRFTGPVANPAYGATNAAAVHPTNGVLIVGRLDGPTADIARALVDKALAAETNGLWGRAYFDLRGLTNGTYRIGDQWLRAAADISLRAGFETVVDDQPATWSAGFPAGDVAFYAGWYDGAVSGPWAQPAVDFRPGAFAYHLHSFSAHVLRTASAYWVGPLLARGVTATVGYTEEPYLEATLEVPLFLSRFLTLGFSFGEAAYAAQPVLSWQTTVLGDPHYRPFGRSPAEAPLGARLRDLHALLLARGSPLVEWSHLQVVNLNLAAGYPVADVEAYLKAHSAGGTNSLLLEKLGTLAVAQGRLGPAIRSYERALKASPPRPRRLRLMFALAELQALFLQERAALQLYGQVLEDYPDYPDRASVLRRMLPLAQGLRLTNEVNRLESELSQGAPPASP